MITMIYLWGIVSQMLSLSEKYDMAGWFMAFKAICNNISYSYHGGVFYW